MLDIAICNDNITELENQLAILDRYQEQRPGFSMRVRRFQALYDLVDHLRWGGGCHLCLLDYHPRQPWMDGRSPQAVLREKAPGLAIVAFTASPHAAFLHPRPDDPLDLAACLPLPLADTDVFQVLDRVAAELAPEAQPPETVLVVPTPGGQREIPCHRLARAHYRGHVVRCVLADGEEVRSSVLRVPFSQLIQPLLQTGNFAWVSASCVVNLAFVRRLDKEASQVEMAGGAFIPVPRAAFAGLRNSLEAYQSRLVDE